MKKKLFFVTSSLLVFGLMIFSISNSKKSRLKEDIIAAMRLNTLGIYTYYSSHGEYPALKDINSDFWSIKSNQYLNFWFKLATDSEQIEHFLNPVTKKFDWLAVGVDNKIYSSSMPESILIASPPIRIKEVRCPLTDTDPPFYANLTTFSVYDDGLHRHFQNILKNSSYSKMKILYEENMKVWNKRH